MEEDICPSCGHWTRTGKEKLAQHSREKPIFKTDFTKPLSTIVEEIRNELVLARGHLSDIGFAFSGWGEQTRNVEGLLTCGLIALYFLAQEMKKVEDTK